MLLELHQGEAGSGRVAALVAPIDTRTLPGLLTALAGENAEADGHGVLHGELMQAGGGLARHDVVMSGLAADDAAERERDLERSRHRNPLIGDALSIELVDRAAGELVGDVLIEARLDDEDRA